MRLNDFDSQWHFVPDRPESLRRFRQTNRAMILFFAIFILGVFIALIVTQPAHNSVTASHFGATQVEKTKALAPQHATAPPPQTR
jgi:hypothetical protein